MSEFGRFFLPGPTEVHPEVLAAMQRPVIGHRSEEIVSLIAGMQPALSRLFCTARPVFLSTTSATGMMEAAVTNLSRRRILCCVCGAFSERFYRIAAATGRAADRLEVEWGEVVRAEQVADRLSGARGRYDLVTVVHSETSTGVLNPVAEISRAVREHEGVLVAVDAVSSLGGAPVRTDEWGLDFVLTGSQKALALPPGLALAVASERAIARAEEVRQRGFYLDLLTFERRMREHQTPTTPSVSLLFALERQLQRIEGEGRERRWERHRQMAARTHAWVKELERRGRGVAVLAPEGFRSPTVTAVTLPAGLPGPEVARSLKGRGFTIAPGYGKLRESTVRIGHMGDHTLDELEPLLACLEEVLESLQRER